MVFKRIIIKKIFCIQKYQIIIFLSNTKNIKLILNTPNFINHFEKYKITHDYYPLFFGEIKEFKTVAIVLPFLGLYNFDTIKDVKYNINFNNNTHDTVDVHEIDFFCNPFKNTDIKKLDGIINDDTKIKSLIDFNVNCINIYFSLNYEINRQRLFNKLVEHDYICKYKPESYSGIKLIYKYGLNNIKNGICSCSDKCTCTNITFLIFQSGNIIVTGFKNTKEIDNILNNFIEYLSLLKENIQKKNTE